jgi:hypothetical protein
VKFNIMNWKVLLVIIICNLSMNVVKAQGSDIQSVDSIRLMADNCLIQDDCNCERLIFNSDSNIYLIKKFSDSPYKFTKYKHCFSVDLFVYGKRLDLDSIYISNIQNKDLLYIGEFISGNLERGGGLLFFELYFINPAINSSRSTLHKYEISFSQESGDFESVKIIWIN